MIKNITSAQALFLHNSLAPLSDKQLKHLYHKVDRESKILMIDALKTNIPNTHDVKADLYNRAHVRQLHLKMLPILEMVEDVAKLDESALDLAVPVAETSIEKALEFLEKLIAYFTHTSEAELEEALKISKSFEAEHYSLPKILEQCVNQVSQWKAILTDLKEKQEKTGELTPEQLEEKESLINRISIFETDIEILGPLDAALSSDPAERAEESEEASELSESESVELAEEFRLEELEASEMSDSEDNVASIVEERPELDSFHEAEQAALNMAQSATESFMRGLDATIKDYAKSESRKIKQAAGLIALSICVKHSRNESYEAELAMILTLARLYQRVMRDFKIS